MRTKLTVKNPQSAQPSRAPVRSGSLVARKPARPTAPSGAAKPAGAGAKSASPKAAGARTFKPRAASERPSRSADAKPGGRVERGETRPYRSAEGKPAVRGERGDSRPYRSAEGKPPARGERGDSRPYRSAEGKPALRGERDDSRPYRSAEGKPPARGERSDSRPYRSAEGKPPARGERSDSRPYRSAEGKPPARGERDDSRPYRSAEGKPPARGERSDSRPYRSAEGKPPAHGERSDNRPYRSTEGKPPARGERSESRPYRSAEGKPPARGERSDSRPYRSAEGKPPARGERGDSRPPRSADGKPSGERTAYRGGSDTRPARDDDRPARRTGSSDDTRRPPRADARETGAKRTPYRGPSGAEDRAKPAFGARRTTTDRPARTPRDGDRPARGAEPDSRRPAERPSADNGFKTARPVKPVKYHADETDHGDETGLLRLSKRMSELGICSRREADEWIEKGWVLVDGKRIDTLGTKVHPDQLIEIDGNARAEQAAQVTILLHKPVGYVSGQAEDGYQPAVTLVTRDNHWDGDRSALRFSPLQLRALAPAGRLDIDSTGLLVLTQNGRVAKQLIGEQSDIDKEYLVRVRFGERLEEIDQHFPAESLAMLRHGLELDDAPLKPAMVSWQNGEQLRFVLREGKKRQIRRMCELVGLDVIGLKRVRMGHVMLGALPPGQWRYLAPDESF